MKKNLEKSRKMKKNIKIKKNQEKSRKIQNNQENSEKSTKIKKNQEKIKKNVAVLINCDHQFEPPIGAKSAYGQAAKPILSLFSRLWFNFLAVP